VEEGDGPEPRRFKRDGTNGGVMPPAGEDGEPEDSEEQGGDHDGHGGTGDEIRESGDTGETAEGTDGTSGSPEGGPVEDVGTEKIDPFEVTGTDDEDSLTGENEDPLAVGEEVGPGGPKRGSGRDDGDDGTSGPVEWVLRSDHTGATFLREFVGSALVVLVIGLLLFAISGVWPPMVAVESGSMEPRMERGDLVFVMDQNRFEPDASVMDTGIATYHSSQEGGYEKFGDYGDVIIYRQDGSQRETPIIHRARFWVNESENWYDKANESFVGGNDCASTTNCPAPHSGFITKGDNNEQYDQVSGISGPVKPGWIKGTAELRIPWLGHVRLELSELSVSPSTRRVSALPRATPGSLVSGAG
jgi:signal peptidase